MKLVVENLNRQHAADKSAAAQLVDDYLRTIQSQFYTGKADLRQFYAQRFMLVQGIATPAKVLKSLGVWLPDKRLREILDDVILGIKRKGNTGGVKHWGAYFLTCIQSHMQIRKDHYYEEGKQHRAKGVATMPMENILKGVTVGDESTGHIVDALVEVAAAFKPHRRKKAVKPAPPTVNQMELI